MLRTGLQPQPCSDLQRSVTTSMQGKDPQCLKWLPRKEVITVDRRRTVISKTDYGRLSEVLESGVAKEIAGTDRAEDLRIALSGAQIVASQDLPDDVVTMNATVRLYWYETGETETYTLVYPHLADIANNRLSILAPVGTAILGHRTGDILHRQVPGGLQQFRIDELIRQPEREPAFCFSGGSS